LITRWQTATGVAEVHDFMPVGPDPHVDVNRTDLVRRLVGVSGTVEFELDLRIRFDYARALPWVRQTGSDESPELVAMAGPDALILRGTRVHADGQRHRARLQAAAGDALDLTLTWFPSYRAIPHPIDVPQALEQTR